MRTTGNPKQLPGFREQELRIITELKALGEDVTPA
jgi:hypothetical protein